MRIYLFIYYRLVKIEVPTKRNFRGFIFATYLRKSEISQSEIRAKISTSSWVTERYQIKVFSFPISVHIFIQGESKIH